MGSRTGHRDRNTHFQSLPILARRPPAIFLVGVGSARPGWVRSHRREGPGRATISLFCTPACVRLVLLLASFGAYTAAEACLQPASGHSFKNPVNSTFFVAAKNRFRRITEKSEFLLLCFLELTFFLAGFRHFRQLLWDRFRNTGGDKNPDKENDRPDPDYHRPTLFSVIKQHLYALQRRVYNSKNRGSGHAIVRNILLDSVGKSPK